MMTLKIYYFIYIVLYKFGYKNTIIMNEDNNNNEYHVVNTTGRTSFTCPTLLHHSPAPNVNYPLIPLPSSS